MQVTVSNALITAILDGVPLDDEAKRRLVADAGLRAESIRDITQRSSILALSRLWKRLIRATGDEFVGLHIGSSVPGERFGLAVHAAQNSDDFRQVLARFCVFARLINDMILCRLEEANGQARFRMKFFWDVFSLERHAVDITFAGVVAWARDHLPTPVRVRSVSLKHGLRSGAPVYERVFAAPVSFGCRHNELVFDADALDLAVIDSRPELGMLLDRFASQEMSRLPALGSLPERISQIVTRELEDGNPVDLARLCADLKMSPRHLQRQLERAHTSFTQIVDDARKQLAAVLILEPDANVEQVGFRLGYAEPTGFIRAFRRWFGITPGEYRQRAR